MVQRGFCSYDVQSQVKLIPITSQSSLIATRIMREYCSFSCCSFSYCSRFVEIDTAATPARHPRQAGHDNDLQQVHRATRISVLTFVVPTDTV